jgi:hypothetical protein
VTPKRAVLDTNVVISALLFRGSLSRLHALWKEKAFIMVASKDIIEEYIRVLAYPKFHLTENEIEALLHEELLPYIEPVTVLDELTGACVDPDDDKFLACACAAKADVIVTGDTHLLSLEIHENQRRQGRLERSDLFESKIQNPKSKIGLSIPIISAEKFLAQFR